MKKKPKVKNIQNLKGYLFALLFLGIIGGLNLWIYMGDKKLTEKGVNVVGLIDDSGGKNLTITYTYNNHTYNVVANKPHSSIEIGEAYDVKINPLDPEDFLIQFWKPIIRTGDFQKGNCTAATKLWFSNLVKFTYTVNGQDYSRVQTVPPSFSKELLTDVTLLYKKANPNVAYLIFQRAK